MTEPLTREQVAAEESMLQLWLRVAHVSGREDGWREVDAFVADLRSRLEAAERARDKAVEDRDLAWHEADDYRHRLSRALAVVEAAEGWVQGWLDDVPTIGTDSDALMKAVTAYRAAKKEAGRE